MVQHLKEARKLIEMVNLNPRIEIFARKKVDDWTCIGNEVDGKDIKESLKELIYDEKN